MCYSDYQMQPIPDANFSICLKNSLRDTILQAVRALVCHIFFAYMCSKGRLFRGKSPQYCVGNSLRFTG